MNRIDKIDKLLKNDLDLEAYINEVEEKQIKIPLNLKERIITKINRKRRIYYTDICKIAACLIFSLAICRTDFIKNDDISKYKDKDPKTSISINEKISDFCKWFTVPLEIEKEEK